MMTPERARRLTDAELSQDLTETRQQLQAIRPYFSRDLEARRRLLWEEYDRRQQARSTTADAIPAS